MKGCKTQIHKGVLSLVTYIVLWIWVWDLLDDWLLTSAAIKISIAQQETTWDHPKAADIKGKKSYKYVAASGTNVFQFYILILKFIF